MHAFPHKTATRKTQLINMVYQKNERAISTKMNAINDTEQKQAHTIGGH